MMGDCMMMCVCVRMFDDVYAKLINIFSTCTALYWPCFFFRESSEGAIFFAIFLLHSRESELYRYTLDGKSALAWKLLFSRFMGHLSST